MLRGPCGSLPGSNNIFASLCSLPFVSVGALAIDLSGIAKALATAGGFSNDALQVIGNAPAEGLRVVDDITNKVELVLQLIDGYVLVMCGLGVRAW